MWEGGCRDEGLLKDPPVKKVPPVEPPPLPSSKDEEGENKGDGDTLSLVEGEPTRRNVVLCGGLEIS